MDGEQAGLRGEVGEDSRRTLTTDRVSFYLKKENEFQRQEYSDPKGVSPLLQNKKLIHRTRKDSDNAEHVVCCCLSSYWCQMRTSPGHPVPL